MLILGIETSCDETACAVVKDGREVRSNVIASQVKVHAPYGGVVPELASRAHIENIVTILDKALKDAEVTLKEIDAFAVTLGPGLIGCLLVGVETAKTLAYLKRKPLIPVHHIAAHLYTPSLDLRAATSSVHQVGDRQNRTETHSGQTDSPADLDYPYLGMVVSGGHSSIVRVNKPGCYKVMGETLDDAAGEAYDKVAKALGLGYPGGPIIDALAKKGDGAAITFPRPCLHTNDYNVSYSGLKTAVVRSIAETGEEKVKESERIRADIAASFQEAAVDVLLAKLSKAVDDTGIRNLAISGGVACNSRLRKRARETFSNCELVIPPPILCTDNAAMVAGVAYIQKDNPTNDLLTLNADANYTLGE